MRRHWNPRDSCGVAGGRARTYPEDVDDIVRLAHGIARKHARRYGNRTWDPEEMASDAMFHGARALLRWDPTRGPPWQTYVATRMTYGLIDDMRHRSLLTRTEMNRGDSVDDLPECRLNPVHYEGVREGPDTARWDMPDPAAEHSLNAVVAEIAVSAFLARLTPRQRDVVIRHDLRGEVYREIAEQMGVTESRVCQIRNQAIKRMQLWAATLEGGRS